MNFRSLLVTGCACALLLGGAAAAQTSSAPAAPAPLPPPPTVTGPSKIAIINIQEAILSTEQGKKLNAALQVRFAPKKTELGNEQDELNKLNSQLTAGGNTMSVTAKTQLQQEIASKQRDFTQNADNAQTDYQNAQSDLLNTVGNTLMPLLKTYAEQHGYTAVIDVSMSWPQSPVLYFNPGTDITGDIVKLFDQAHPATTSSTSSTSKPAAAK